MLLKEGYLSVNSTLYSMVFIVDLSYIWLQHSFYPSEKLFDCSIPHTNVPLIITRSVKHPSGTLDAIFTESKLMWCMEPMIMDDIKGNDWQWWGDLRGFFFSGRHCSLVVLAVLGLTHIRFGHYVANYDKIVLNLSVKVYLQLILT